MDLRQVKLPISEVDFGSLRTEEDFRTVARRLLPAILAQLSGEAAGAAWDKSRETYEGIGGMTGTPSAAEEDKFMDDSARGYRKRASDADLQAIEDEIVRQLKERKAES